MYELKTRPSESDLRGRVNDIFHSALKYELTHQEIINRLSEQVYLPLSDQRVRGRIRLRQYVQGLVEGHLWHLWKAVIWVSKNPETGVLQVANYDAYKVPSETPYEWTKEFSSASINWPSAHVWPKSGREFSLYEVQ